MVAALSLKEKNQDTINQAIGQLQQGRDNASGSVTLAAGPGPTTTTVLNPNCSPTSGVQITAATADAAAALSTTYVSTVGKGQFTITHAAGPPNDRTFLYRIHGGN